MKKLVASLVSIMLVVGLMPTSAFAQEASNLAAANPTQVLSIQAKKPGNATKKKMKAAYKKVLKQAQAKSASYGGFGFGSEYAMFDIGADGYPELFVETSDPSWGGSFHVFDYASGKARHLGICSLGDGWLYGAKGGKLYLSSGRSGGYSVCRVVKSGGKVVVKYGSGKSFIAKNLDDWESALNRCHAYVKKLGATALKTKPVTSYSLLNNKIKVKAVKTSSVMKAASKKTTLDKKAKAGLVKKAGSLAKSNYSVRYKLADLDGDGVSEMLVQKHETEGMWSDFLVYAYKSGKVKRLINRHSYGDWTSLKSYKESKSIVAYGSGHGGEAYCYFKLSSGKFKEVAAKSRSNVTGSWSAWSYYKPSGGQGNVDISKTEFDALVANLTKGKAVGIKGPFYWKSA